MFDHDIVSRDNLINSMEIWTLKEFNSMNVCTHLARIDRDLVHVGNIGPDESQVNDEEGTQQVSETVIKVLAQ